jgi:hypothetical protein
LNSLQNIVKDCPELAKIQRDLEETNFNTINTLPIASVLSMTNGNIISPDLNANETINNSSSNGTENGNSQIIDSTA